jgi:di- and tripeptidase
MYLRRALQVGDWWLGNYDNELYDKARAAVKKAWGVEPHYVREGGTMPQTRFMENCFQAPALHLPLGMSSDCAHLPNERIRAHNLVKGKEVIKHILRTAS